MEDWKDELKEGLKESSKSFWKGFYFMAGAAVFITIFLWRCSVEMEKENEKMQKQLIGDMKKMQMQINNDLNKAFQQKPQQRQQNYYYNTPKRQEPRPQARPKEQMATVEVKAEKYQEYKFQEEQTELRRKEGATEAMKEREKPRKPEISLDEVRKFKEQKDKERRERPLIWK